MMESMHGVLDEGCVSPLRPPTRAEDDSRSHSDEDGHVSSHDMSAQHSDDCDAQQHREQRRKLRDVAHALSALSQDAEDAHVSTSERDASLYVHRINALNVEVLELRQALRQEQHAKEVIRELTDKSDKELAKLIKQERERADEKARLYELLLDDYHFLLEQYETINERKEQEVRDIVKHANDTQVRCAALEEENDKLLNDLVNFKVEFANLSMLVDDLRAEKKDLQRALSQFQQLVDRGELVRRDTLCDKEKDKEREGFDPFSAAPIKPVLVHVQSSNLIRDEPSPTGSVSTSDALPGLHIVSKELVLNEDATTCEEIVFV